jgi:cytochrome b subunit of formate dehydrogenase
MRRTGQKKANDIGKRGQQAFRASGTKFSTSSPMTGIVMMMIMMDSCSWLRWAGGDIEAFYLGWKVRIWMGVLLRPFPLSALSLSLARVDMDDVKWICGFQQMVSQSHFDPEATRLPSGPVVWTWSSAYEGY